VITDSRSSWLLGWPFQAKQSLQLLLSAMAPDCDLECLPGADQLGPSLEQAHQEQLELATLQPMTARRQRGSTVLGWLDLLLQELQAAGLERAAIQLQRRAHLHQLSLLEGAAGGEPILRTIHHFACTGGTVISKCLAALPQVMLISEINPINRNSPKFNPSHPLALLEQRCTTPLAEPWWRREFADQLSLLIDWCREAHCDLVLRDHSHSDYCSGPSWAKQPTLLGQLPESSRIFSVVTLRHPLDSWLGLCHAGWQGQLHPPSLLNYCQRYDQFLNHYEHTPWFYYEDFCREPAWFLELIGEELCLGYDPKVIDNFAEIQLSGDSGRKDNAIAPRPRRPIPGEIQSELNDAATRRALLQLCERMGYPLQPRAHTSSKCQ
jgi:hypothetical protein